MNPSYPVYIVSKGRWTTCLTSKAFDKISVPYHIVIEPQEYENYAAVIDPDKIFVLPFGNLGQGSIPARNWIWEHALSTNAERFWLLDDNILGFSRLNHNEKINVASGTIFKAAEDFVDRYTNIAVAGFGYHFMAGGERRKKPPFRLNTGVYSCMLIKTDIPYRFRGIYNEDSDLSIRVLKDGWCTLIFLTFLQNKVATMTMAGGNTDELYKENGRQLMAESLQSQHPDVVKVIKKWGRYQHEVSYKTFKDNKLIKKDGLIVPQGINNYGMVIKEQTK